jgi:hypothetical protein
MPDEKITNNQENKNTSNPSSEADSNKNSESAENNSQDEKEPTLAEDYEALKNMNLLKNTMIRMQYGRYPNKKIESILQRRMDLDASQYQGPQIVRMIITIMAMFFFCSFTYVIIWLITSHLNLYGIKETASMVLSTLFLGSCGFALFNYISVPDEKKLKEAIKNRMAEIEKELNSSTNENDKSNPEKQS